MYVDAFHIHRDIKMRSSRLGNYDVICRPSTVSPNVVAHAALLIPCN